jgi:methyl-accepting chemotaxis protein
MAIQASRNDDDMEPPIASTTDRSFLGGISSGTRTWLFFLACVMAAVAFGGLFYYADQRMDEAIQEMQRGSRIDELVNNVERGTYSLQARQRNFLLTRNTEIADGFSADLADISAALDELFAYPEAQPLAQHVTTIRDGLVQYDQQFQTFINTEREIGLGTESGLAAQLSQTSANLRAVFRETGNPNLINQIERIDQQGQETVLSGSKTGVEEIIKRYEALTAFVEVADINETARGRVDELLKTHETQLLRMINARFELAAESRRFEDLFEYFVPSLVGLASFAERMRIETAAKVRNTQLLTRYSVLAGAAAIIVWLFFFGLVLIKSLTGPAKRIADAGERLRHGAPNILIPAQGNRDDFGRIARLLDGWADTIIEAEQLRRDLERTQDRLDRTVLEAEATHAIGTDAQNLIDAAERRAREAEAAARDAEAAARAAKAEAQAQIQAHMQSYENASPQTEQVDGAYEYEQEYEERPLSETAREIREAEIVGGPISSVSQRLENFTQYVTAAANDVERTEALIGGIDQLTELVGDIGELVVSIRDQTNALAFQTPGRDALRDRTNDDDNTLVPFAEDSRRVEAERNYSKRFDALRESTSRTERVALQIRETLDGVNDIARDIAETASYQALEATNKLLSQSEYLQHMLDDILTKVQPAKPGALSERRPLRRSNDDPFA